MEKKLVDKLESIHDAIRKDEFMLTTSYYHINYSIQGSRVERLKSEGLKTAIWFQFRLFKNHEVDNRLNW